MKTSPQFATAAKAIVGAVVALAGAMATASADGHVTQPEVWLAVGTTLAALGVVYRVPNADGEPE